MTWHNFDTAPHNRPFLAYCPGKGIEVVAYRNGRLILNFDGLYVDEVYSVHAVRFTHWQECPDPPADTDDN